MSENHDGIFRNQSICIYDIQPVGKLLCQSEDFDRLLTGHQVWPSDVTGRVTTRGITSVGVVEEDKAAPVVVVEQRQQRPPDGRPQLQGKLALCLGGEAGRHQADVQRPAEGRQRVDRALVVEAEDGEDPSGVLGADWEEEEQAEH